MVNRGTLNLSHISDNSINWKIYATTIQNIISDNSFVIDSVSDISINADKVYLNNLDILGTLNVSDSNISDEINNINNNLKTYFNGSDFTSAQDRNNLSIIIDTSFNKKVSFDDKVTFNDGLIVKGNVKIESDIVEIITEQKKVHDDILIIGTSSESLNENDGNDKGIILEYYDSDTSKNAFIGLINISNDSLPIDYKGKFVLANNCNENKNKITNQNFELGDLYIKNLDLSNQLKINNVVDISQLGIELKKPTIISNTLHVEDKSTLGILQATDVSFTNLDVSNILQIKNDFSYNYIKDLQDSCYNVLNLRQLEEFVNRDINKFDYIDSSYVTISGNIDQHSRDYNYNYSKIAIQSKISNNEYNIYIYDYDFSQSQVIPVTNNIDIYKIFINYISSDYLVFTIKTAINNDEEGTVYIYNINNSNQYISSQTLHKPDNNIKDYGKFSTIYNNSLLVTGKDINSNINILYKYYLDNLDNLDSSLNFGSYIGNLRLAENCGKIIFNYILYNKIGICKIDTLTVDLSFSGEIDDYSIYDFSKKVNKNDYILINYKSNDYKYKLNLYNIDTDVSYNIINNEQNEINYDINDEYIFVYFDSAYKNYTKIYLIKDIVGGKNLEYQKLYINNDILSFSFKNIILSNNYYLFFGLEYNQYNSFTYFRYQENIFHDISFLKSKSILTDNIQIKNNLYGDSLFMSDIYINNGATINGALFVKGSITTNKEIIAEEDISTNANVKANKIISTNGITNNNGDISNINGDIYNNKGKIYTQHLNINNQNIELFNGSMGLNVEDISLSNEKDYTSYMNDENYNKYVLNFFQIKEIIKEYIFSKPCYIYVYKDGDSIDISYDTSYNVDDFKCDNSQNAVYDLNSGTFICDVSGYYHIQYSTSMSVSGQFEASEFTATLYVKRHGETNFEPDRTNISSHISSSFLKITLMISTLYHLNKGDEITCNVNVKSDNNNSFYKILGYDQNSNQKYTWQSIWSLYS